MSNDEHASDERAAIAARILRELAERDVGSLKGFQRDQVALWFDVAPEELEVLRGIMLEVRACLLAPSELRWGRTRQALAVMRGQPLNVQTLGNPLHAPPAGAGHPSSPWAAGPANAANSFSAPNPNPAVAHPPFVAPPVPTAVVLPQAVPVPAVRRSLEPIDGLGRTAQPDQKPLEPALPFNVPTRKPEGGGRT